MENKQSAQNISKISSDIISSRRNFLYIITFAISVLVVGFSIYALIQEENLEFALNLLVVALLFVNIFVFSKYNKIDTAYNNILLIFLSFFLIMVSFDEFSEFNLFWFNIFPVIAFLLKGSKKGIFWIIGFISLVFVVALLDRFEIIQTVLDLKTSGSFILNLLFLSLIIYFFQRTFDSYNKIIETTNSQLVTSVAQLVKEIAQRKRSEEELDKIITEEEKKNKTLEETKVALLNVMDDIEEEKRISQNTAKDLEKFKLAVENASDHILITDTDGVVLYANRSAEQITGYTYNEIIGTKAGVLWGNQMPKEYYESFWKTVKIDKKSFTGEINNVRKNGEKYIAEIYVSPILDDRGEVAFFVGIERDITKAKEVDKAKTEFVSLASHQLKTPLSSINWYTELLRSGQAGEMNNDQRSFVDEIFKASHRMVDLVDSLLNVSRLELGTFSVEPVDVNLAAVVKNAVNDLRHSAEERQLTIEENYNPQDLTLSADPKLTRIVIDNLLTNSIKYTPNGGHISVSIYTDPVKNMAVLKVSDTGYGIPEADKAKIFTKLFRADNVKLKDTDGTGLGLYIIKSILETTGGTIYFDSKENQGTTFFVEIPLSGMRRKEGTRQITPVV